MITMVPKQQTAEGAGVVAQGAEPERRRFFAPRLAAMAIGAMIGMKRLKSITRPAAMSHGMADRRGRRDWR